MALVGRGLTTQVGDDTAWRFPGHRRRWANLVVSIWLVLTVVRVARGTRLRGYSIRVVCLGFLEPKSLPLQGFPQGWDRVHGRGRGIRPQFVVWVPLSPRRLADDKDGSHWLRLVLRINYEKEGSEYSSAQDSRSGANPDVVTTASSLDAALHNRMGTGYLYGLEGILNVGALIGGQEVASDLNHCVHCPDDHALDVLGYQDGHQDGGAQPGGLSHAGDICYDPAQCRTSKPRPSSSQADFAKYSNGHSMANRASAVYQLLSKPTRNNWGGRREGT